MSRYDLYDHRRKTEFRSLGGHFANFSSSVIRISEEIFSQQAVCMSYTSAVMSEARPAIVPGVARHVSSYRVQFK